MHKQPVSMVKNARMRIEDEHSGLCENIEAFLLQMVSFFRRERKSRLIFDKHTSIRYSTEQMLIPTAQVGLSHKLEEL